MTTVIVSTKGQIVLPASLRRRLGLNAGARLEISESGDELRLRPVRSVARTDVRQLAGMVTAQATGEPRRLSDFDPASLAASSGKPGA